MCIHEMASVKNLVRECRIATEAIVNWRTFIRDIYAEYFCEASFENRRTRACS